MTKKVQKSRQKRPSAGKLVTAKEFAPTPTMKELAGRFSAVLLDTLASKMEDRYPKISGFIKDNLDLFEAKIGGKSSYQVHESEGSHVRH